MAEKGGNASGKFFQKGESRLRVGKGGWQGFGGLSVRKGGAGVAELRGKAIF